MSQSGRRNKRLGVRFSFAEKDEIKKQELPGKTFFLSQYKKRPPYKPGNKGKPIPYNLISFFATPEWSYHLFVRHPGNFRAVFSLPLNGFVIPLSVTPECLCERSTVFKNIWMLDKRLQVWQRRRVSR